MDLLVAGNRGVASAMGIIGEEPWAVFSRQLDDRVARLDLIRDHLMDRRSGERWDPERGLKTEGPSNPEILVQLMATWFPQ
jgi:hypothetical protein